MNENVMKPVSKYLKDYIKVIDDIIPTELCDRILEEYSNSTEFNNAETFSGLNTNIRNCKVLNISGEGAIKVNPIVRKKIDNDIFLSVSKIFSILNEQYEFINITEDCGYDLLKYDEAGFYTQHIDTNSKYNRHISCSLLLNDDYVGGEFSFFSRELTYKPKKGSAIVFPSNFMYPHEIMPVFKGTRYSIITWFK